MSLRPSLFHVMAMVVLLAIGCSGGGPTGAGGPTISAIITAGAVGESGDTVTFRATVAGTVDSYAWTFGGGTTPNESDQATPAVLLGAPGTYQATLTVGHGNDRSAPHQFEYTIAVPRLARVIGVTPEGVAGVAGTSVTFGVAVNGTPTGFHWDFGDGAAPRTSEVADPFVMLLEPGTYEGSVTATNEIGTTLPFVFTYVVADPEAPVVTSVTPVGEIPALGKSQIFVATASNNPETYRWAFGGGVVPGITTGQTPTVQLEEIGTFQGSVIATNRAGSSPNFNFQYTIVPHANAPLVVGMIPGTLIVGRVGDFVTFAPTVSNPVPEDPTFDWNFSQGVNPSTSSASNPNVRLNFPGLYSAKVTVANSFGRTPPFMFQYSIQIALRPPEILTITPDDTGVPGSEVTFSATTNRPVTSYDWNFGGGATPNTSSEASPTVTCGSSGAYTGGLRVSNTEGEDIEFFEFFVGPDGVPVISNVTFDGTTIALGSDLVFTAVASNLPDEWHWDFGDGALLTTASTAEVGAILSLPGEHTGTVIAANDFGDSVPFEFDYTVTGVPLPAWNDHVIAPLVGSSISMAASDDGRPAVVYRAEAGGYWFALATSPTPSSPADWMSHSFDAGTDSTEVSPLSLVFHDGRPAVLFEGPDVGPSADPFLFARAAVAEPTSVADWTKHAPNLAGELVGQIALATRGGRLEILHHHRSASLSFGRAQIAEPTVSSDWIFHNVNDGSNDNNTSIRLLQQDGLPVFLYAQSTCSTCAQLEVGFGLTAEPASQGDWQVAEATNDGQAGQIEPDLAFSGGTLAIAYVDSNETWLGKARVATPGGPGSWTHHVASIRHGLPLELRLVDLGDRPAMFGTGPFLRLLRAEVPDPLTPDDWMLHPIAPYGSRLTAAAIFDNRPAAVYLDTTAGSNWGVLHYVRSLEDL